MTNTTTEASKAEKKCLYCYGVIQTPHQANIIRTGYDPVRRKKVVVKENLTFCGEQCASHYQMSCEG